MTAYANPGLDQSGNGNNWTVNNINWTGSGSTFDTMTDSPTPASATVGNYCVLNPIAPGDYFASGQTSLTLTSANLNYGTGGRNAFGSIAVSSGKYYWEMSNTANTSSAVTLFGLVTVAARTSVYGVYYNSSNGNKGLGTLNSGASETSYGASWTDNDVIGVALDMDAATPTVTFYKNNASQGAISVSSFVGQSVMAWIQNGANSGNMSGWANFGQRPFAYTPPSGFNRLQTYNLPTPTIGATASSQANKYFDATLWTGDGSTTPRAITNSGGFQPDLVWFKNRTSAYDHGLYDSVRGAGSSKGLGSNVTYAEGGIDGAYYGYLDSFTSNGFSLTAGSGPSPQKFYLINQSSNAYVGWQWKANGTGVTNTAGSITSTVSANTTSGFSVVTFTTTSSGTLSTVGHGLGVAPKMIITKGRGPTLSDWVVYHASVCTATNQYLILNTTQALSTATDIWGSALPTSTVFGLKSGTQLPASQNAVAYCFSEVAGFSKFGSYTGNGSSDGPFVYTGFRPAMIWTKPSSDAGAWNVLDNKRGSYNVNQPYLQQNSSNAEATVDYVDFLSNGFKIRYNGATPNGSGQTILYIAFAESPFNYSLAR